MDDGYKIQKYFRCLDIAHECGLYIDICGGDIQVTYKEGQIAGRFNDIDTLFGFITGFDQGLSTGKVIQLKGEKK